MSCSAGGEEVWLRAAGHSGQRETNSFKLKAKESHPGACLLAPDELYGFRHCCYLEYTILRAHTRAKCVLVTGLHNAMKFYQASPYLHMHFSKPALHHDAVNLRK